MQTSRFRRLRAHLTYANVASTIALLIAVGGGTAWAAATIGSGAIIDNSVQSRDVRDGTIASRDIADGTVVSRDVSGLTAADIGGLGSADITDGTLTASDLADGAGSSVDADLLDGVDSSAFQRRGATTSCAAGSYVSQISATGDVTCAAAPTNQFPVRMWGFVGATGTVPLSGQAGGLTQAMVTKPAATTGIYCIQMPAGFAPIPFASLANNTNNINMDGWWIQASRGNSSDCPGSGDDTIRVATGNSGFAPVAADAAFHILAL